MIERYSRYYSWMTDAPTPDPDRCDALVSVRYKNSVSGYHNYQCSRRPVDNGLCRVHAKKDKK